MNPVEGSVPASITSGLVASTHPPVPTSIMNPVEGSVPASITSGLVASTHPPVPTSIMDRFPRLDDRVRIRWPHDFPPDMKEMIRGLRPFDPVMVPSEAVMHRGESYPTSLSMRSMIRRNRGDFNFCEGTIFAMMPEHIEVYSDLLAMEERALRNCLQMEIEWEKREQENFEDFRKNCSTGPDRAEYERNNRISEYNIDMHHFREWYNWHVEWHNREEESRCRRVLSLMTQLEEIFEIEMRLEFYRVNIPDGRYLGPYGKHDDDDDDDDDGQMTVTRIKSIQEI